MYEVSQGVVWKVEPESHHVWWPNPQLLQICRPDAPEGVYRKSVRVKFMTRYWLSNSPMTFMFAEWCVITFRTTRRSKHCATLLQWDNIYYQPPTDSFVDKKDDGESRTGAMADAFISDAGWCVWAGRVFIDAVSGYKSDFVLFPEYFNAPLMANSITWVRLSLFVHWHSTRRKSETVSVNLAIKHNINIITGSMPYVKEDGGLTL